MNQTFNIGEKLKFQNINFEIISKIGKGADGIVYIVKVNRKYDAIKIIPNLCKREARILSIIKDLSCTKNEYLLEYYGSYNYENFTIIHMEYFGAYSLREYIYLFGGILTLKTFWIITEKLIRGMYHIHSLKISHNDMFEENIMIDKNLNIKYIDFCRSHYDTECIGPIIPNKLGTTYILDPKYDDQYDTLLEFEQKMDIIGLAHVLLKLLLGFDKYKEMSNFNKFEIFTKNIDHIAKNPIEAQSSDDKLDYLLKKLCEPNLRDRFSSKEALDFILLR